LLAAGSGRRVNLESTAGRKAVLIFHLQRTAPTAREINRAVRAQYSPEEVLIASVIDLSIVPPVYWMSFSLILNTAYDQAAAELPSEADPTDYVMILPDWSGFVSRKYGARNTGRATVIVIVDEDSNVASYYQGERPVEAVFESLEPK